MVKKINFSRFFHSKKVFEACHFTEAGIILTIFLEKGQISYILLKFIFIKKTRAFS